MELFLWDNNMTVKEAIEYIISESKKDESLLTDTKRFWAYLSDLAPEHRKELKVIKRSLDSEFLTLCFKDKEDIKRRVFKMKFRLEEQGVGENWIDFIIESFFTPLGWKPPQDEEETSQTQKQQTQNQQTQNQQTQKQQNGGTRWYVAILILIGICILAIISNNSNENVTYSTIETTNKSYNQTEKIETKEITLANVGDYIKFGNYPQTAEGGEQPIEWQVLSKENNKMLVISRYGLDAKRFDGSSNKWQNSEIRKWLNGDFYNTAFSDSEKKYINSSYLSDVGTSDNVFLLSKEEAKKYFANNDVRRCKATDYAVKNGALVANDNGYGAWWLRSPFLCSIYRVLIIGFIYCYGDIYDDCNLARPALWINLNKEAVTYSTIETTNKSYNQTEKIETKEITLANVGDYIKFGNYPQTAEGGEQPIEWQVLSKENNKMLVISRYGLDAKRFDGSSNKWQNSEIRKWLNGDFYNTAFSDSEKKYINSSYLSDVGTSDNVFLLSKEEAEKYFANDDLRRCKATDYAVKNDAWVNDGGRFSTDLGAKGYSYWWLRSPSPNIMYGVYSVNAGGNFSRRFYHSCHIDDADVVARPALWINL